MNEQTTKPLFMFWSRLSAVFLGCVFVSLLTVLAWIFSVWFGLSVVVAALLLGIMFSGFVSAKLSLGPGIRFCAEPLMKIGVICLGAGVNIGLLASLGLTGFAVIFFGVLTTLGLGVLIGKRLGLSKRFSVLAAGAVAVCGSSAALALSCVLPHAKTGDRDLATVIISVSVLSSVGMLFYPLITHVLGLSDVSAGFVVGGSLHNVAQAIASGLSISPESGEAAAIAKMTRVTFLAPLVMVVAVLFQQTAKSGKPVKRFTMPPLFLIYFLALMGFASADLIPEHITCYFAITSKVCLLLAMTAIGLSTPIRAVLKIDKRALVLLVLLTFALLLFALGGTLLLEI